MAKKIVHLPGSCPCYVEVEVEVNGNLSEDELMSIAREKFEDNPRNYSVFSYNKHKGIASPKDFEINED